MPISNQAHFVRPNFDVATEYGSHYMGIAAQYASRRMQVTDLYREDASRENIIKSLEEMDPIFCYWLGHGNEDTFTSQNQEVVMQTCTGNERLIGRVLLLLSCSCGVRLGPDTANKGALSVFSFAVDFIWVATGDISTDPYAGGFFEAINTISNSVVDGYTTGEAFNRSIEVWNKWVDFWSGSTDPYASMVIQYLIQDRDGMRLFGDPTTRIATPSPPIPGDGVIQLTPLIIGEVLTLLSIIA